VADAKTILCGRGVIWSNITIPKSSDDAADLYTLVKAGMGDAEDSLVARIIAWKIFKEKDTDLDGYYVGDDASLTVARAYGATEECSSSDFPVYAEGLKTIFLGAQADADITAGFYAILAPTTP
jgi:hypothetical protein